jgi:hypothetical protein
MAKLITFFPWRWGGSNTQARMHTYGSILRIPQMIWVWKATVEWYSDRGKPMNSEEKPVPVPLCPPQIPHGLTRARTRASAMRGRRLTTWAMARPKLITLQRGVSHYTDSENMFFPVFLKIIRPVQKVIQIKFADLEVFYTYVINKLL